MEGDSGGKDGQDRRFKAIKQPRKRVDKRKSIRMHKRKGFHGSKIGTTAQKTTNDTSETTAVITTTTTPPASLVVTGDLGEPSTIEGGTSIMEKKQGRDLEVTPKKITRKRQRESAILSPNAVTPLHGYKIIDSSILNTIMEQFSKCPSCGECLQLLQDNGKKLGLCETLLLFCKTCNVYVKKFRTSNNIKERTNCNANSKVNDINLRSVIATTSAGGGLTSLRRFCVDMNLPEPVTENPYNRYIRVVEEAAKKNCNSSLSDAAQNLRNIILDGEEDAGQIVDVSVSVDGAWQKRYGFNSLHGMIFVISIDTGQVLDYAIKSKTCHQCKSNKNATSEWKEKHSEVCCINHEGSSGSMETAGAIEMFVRSIEKHNLRYTTYVGDGDSSAFGKVKEALVEKHGEGQYPLEKEDCIGHIQKRMGTALRSYKNGKRGTRLTDGKGVGGAGRLTDAKVDRIQTYFGYAIRNNKGNTENIRKAIWAIFFHCIAGPPNESLAKQHSFCPQTEDTWCKYQRDISQGTHTYDKSKCITWIFREELKPIFTRLSSDTVLNGCQRGLTQNQNEALNSVVWSRCPKRLFCGTHRYAISVCDGVTQFNDGAKGRYRLFKTLNLNSHNNSLKGLQREQRIRLRKAAAKVTAVYKKRRQALRQIRKTKKTDKSYIAGGFSTGSVPDIDFTNEPVNKPVIDKPDTTIEVLFISDENVIQNIYLTT